MSHLQASPYSSELVTSSGTAGKTLKGCTILKYKIISTLALSKVLSIPQQIVPFILLLLQRRFEKIM
jgi:hypothetical protein